MVKRFSRYLPATITALLILVFTAMPGQAVTSVGLGKESYHINGHFIAYLVLCLTLFRAFSFIKGAKRLWLSFLVSVIYGILMEFLQKLVPGRAFQYLDIGVNSLGSVLALLLLWKQSFLLPRPLSNWLKK
ncbi:hypothetical protein GF360_01260 [candidate division WWE3 bacterium]|nr:hypothetical protein [candidate division WWE3 bacterium]